MCRASPAAEHCKSAWRKAQNSWDPTSLLDRHAFRGPSRRTAGLALCPWCSAMFPLRRSQSDGFGREVPFLSFLLTTQMLLILLSAMSTGLNPSSLLGYSGKALLVPALLHSSGCLMPFSILASIFTFPPNPSRTI